MAEVEAKFLVQRPEQIDEVLATLADLGFTSAEVHTKTHVDTYFDTSDFAIFRAGWTYRCRQSGDDSKLNLKSCGTKHGQVFVREELEQPLFNGQLSVNGEVPPGPVQDRLDRMIGDRRKRKLFTVRSRRRVFAVSRSGNGSCHFEIDLDRTRINAKKAKKKAPGSFEFIELELEHGSGDARVVDEVAETLRERIGLVPAQFSKFDRGIQAAGLSIADASTKHCEPGTTGTDRFLDLLYRHVQHYLDMLKRYQPLAWEGLHPEGVHKMRVAIRHVRAMLRIYADIFADGNGEQLDRELRALAKQLGHARDADVCEMEIRGFNATLPPSAAKAARPYEDHLRETTIAAYSALAELFASDDYAQQWTRIENFMASGPSATAQANHGNLSVADAADRDVRKAARKMLRRGDKVVKGSPAKQLHKLRIQAKRLRYLLDFFAVAMPARWSESIAALEELQELLGAHQDAVTARERLEAYANSLPTAGEGYELRLSIGRLIHTQDDRIVDCRRHFPAAWSTFKQAFDRPAMIVAR